MAEVFDATPSRIIPAGVKSLRFPKLFALVVLLFLLDLVVPDFLPFADEIILGVLSLMLGMLRKQRKPPTDEPT